jgi:phenylacetate-CoA ligase
MYWNKEETLPRKELEELQLAKLQAVVKRVYDRVPFYRQKFDALGLKPEHIKKLADLRNLPFTVKDDLRDNYPYGLFATPMSEVVRVHASSGTTGKPTVVGYTRKDIETWSDLIARCLVSAGAHQGDIIHNAYGYGLFTGGLGFHYGAERIGATVIPVSGGNTQRQILIMKDFGSTILTCTPSYALYLADVAQEQGVDIKKLKLRVGIHGAEPWSERMRDEIEKRLGIAALDIYGLSEVIGPGVSCECIEEKHGLHVYEDHFLVEVIDPKSGQPVAPGEQGELVFTTLSKEAFPLIRYRTKDLSRLNTEPCKCGRTSYRMSRITGRTDDMLIIRGVNVFPSQIEHVLLNIEGLEPHYLIIVDRKGALDDLEVQVEVSEKIFSDEMKKMDQLKNKLENDLKDYLGVNAKVTLVEPKTIQRSEGKAKRVVDKRKL